MAKEAIYYDVIETIKAKIDDYKQLVKFRLSLTVVISSVLAYLISASWNSSLKEIMFLTLGGFFVTGASNALNEVLEKDFDKMMKRTENRPLPTGRMSVSEAVIAAGWMSVLGIVLLATLNPLAGLLGAISLVWYSFLYTPIKRISPFSVMLGAVPGALPVLIGCVAFDGRITALAILLFGIQFFWQFPHFWAIADLGRADYKKAGFKVISDKADAKTLGLQSLLYATVLLPIIFGLFAMNYIGLFNVIFLTVLTLAYMWFCNSFKKKQTRKAALQVMFSSFIYLPLFLLAMVIEQFL